MQDKKNTRQRQRRRRIRSYDYISSSPDSIMDLDFTDLDSSWQFDQILTSPLQPSTSNHSFSPLWASPEFNDDKTTAGVASSAFPVDIRFSPDCSRLLTCNPEAVNENPGDDDAGKRRPPAPVLGLTPLELPDVSFKIKERMSRALRYFKQSTEQHQILAQVWVPIKSGNQYVLTTSGQPFVLGPRSNGLHQYRTVSLTYMFSVDGESDGPLGLPGRVFSQKLLEWTPNVQYYSSKEYPRLNHAKHYNVRGSLALPVFEPSGQSCVGVLEIIMNSQKINYAPEVDKVCKALEAVNLKSSEILDHSKIQICNEGRQNALAEILEVLIEVCETYKLPLAQTWVPCRHRSVLAYGGGRKKSCSSFDGSCMEQVCMSISDAAFYVVDADMWGFHEACAEHHLQKGQGVAGRAFSSLGMCFCGDIAHFCKTEYPLVHYARMFGLTSCFAICLRSKHTGNDDYVLEFFLPASITDSSEQHELVDSILAVMKLHFHSLMVASGKVVEEERTRMEIIDVPMDENLDLNVESNYISPPTNSIPVFETLNGGLLASLDASAAPIMEEIDAVKDGGNVGGVGGSHDAKFSSGNQQTKKMSERKRGKAEKQISLEVLQQYFAGSLKDAAKSLGVCPTTMKRICRQHGISRWPSRKINKVNRSLSKLQRVIESVQGANGQSPISLTSIPVAVGTISWPANLNRANQQQSPGSKLLEYPDERIQLPSSRTSGGDGHGEQVNRELGDSPNGYKSGSGSREVSSGDSTSHRSCQGSPTDESIPPNGHFVSSFHEEPFSVLDALISTHHEEPFGGMLVEDAGSLKDLRNLCPSAADTNVNEEVPESDPSPNRQAMFPSAAMVSRFSTRQDMRTATIKATYREDTIRFRLSLNSSIVDLREEVAKRLTLEIGTFEIKYLDDDQEWVIIACDSDMQECLEISRSSGSSVIRLLIQDIMGNLWGSV
ncbi:hypothetical protein Nepgr_011158 [Nepenthes gracilis]|uniref:Uncharacterized protein n=1 Tax=Nepenthes gracilis TaxID=150966 RepID=A0AAD3SEP5_NEPGR|nr:hypothetical protein Nepgr_011158 [Nepenthes gracilis]